MNPKRNRPTSIIPKSVDQGWATIIAAIIGAVCLIGVTLIGISQAQKRDPSNSPSQPNPSIDSTLLPNTSATSNTTPTIPIPQSAFFTLGMANAQTILPTQASSYSLTPAGTLEITGTSYSPVFIWKQLPANFTATVSFALDELSDEIAIGLAGPSSSWTPNHRVVLGGSGTWLKKAISIDDPYIKLEQDLSQHFLPGNTYSLQFQRKDGVLSLSIGSLAWTYNSDPQTVGAYTYLFFTANSLLDDNIGNIRIVDVVIEEIN